MKQEIVCGKNPVAVKQQRGLIVAASLGSKSKLSQWRTERVEPYGTTVCLFTPGYHGNPSCDDGNLVSG